MSRGTPGRCKGRPSVLVDNAVIACAKLDPNSVRPTMLDGRPQRPIKLLKLSVFGLEEVV